MAQQITTPGTINTDPAMMGFFGQYGKLKSKYKLVYDGNLYANMGYNVLLSMFEYDEKVYRPELLDMILHDTGVAALIKTDTADYTPVFCSFTGSERYADGFMKDVICFDLAGNEYSFSDWHDNEKVLVFFNNILKTPDTFISKYADMLAECDASINNNVIFSRLKPVPVAGDQATKNQVDLIIRDLLQNKLETVVTGTKLKDIVDGKGNMIDVINLTNVEHSKYIQHLSHLYDNLLSRFFMHMGLSIDDTGKMAQVTVDEVNKNKAASIAITNSWFRPRFEGFEIAKQKTGQEWYFDFSEIWKSEIAKTETDENGNTIPDVNEDSQLSESSEQDPEAAETEGDEE